MLLIWGTGSGERVREGTEKLKIGTNRNLNPSPIRNFISNSRNLFPLFIFPFPVLVPCSFFLVLVTCNWIQWMKFMWTTASESIQPALKLVWVWLNSNSIRAIPGTAYEPGPKSPVSSKTWTLNESSKDACLHVYMAKTSPSRRVTLQTESTLANLYVRKRLIPLLEWTARAWLSHLDWVVPAWWAKVFIWRRVSAAARVMTLTSQKSDPAGRARPG